MVLSATDCATVFRATIIVRKHGQSPGSRRIYRFKADSMGYDQEIQDAWNPFSSSRKSTPLQANARNLGHHRGTKARGRRDNNNWLLQYRTMTLSISPGKRFHGSLLIAQRVRGHCARYYIRLYTANYLLLTATV